MSVRVLAGGRRRIKFRYLGGSVGINVIYDAQPDQVAVPADALRRIEEAIEEIANCPILEGHSGNAEHPARMTLRIDDLSTRIAAAREAVKALPTPDANPVLTEPQRAILQEAVSAYDRPLEHEKRHTDQQTLDRALKRILHREGVQ